MATGVKLLVDFCRRHRSLWFDQDYVGLGERLHGCYYLSNSLNKASTSLEAKRNIGTYRQADCLQLSKTEIGSIQLVQTIKYRCGIGASTTESCGHRDCLHELDLHPCSYPALRQKGLC